MSMNASTQQYRVEFCSKGGSFGCAIFNAASEAVAVARVNGSSLVHPNETSLTRAEVWPRIA